MNVNTTIHYILTRRTIAMQCWLPATVLGSDVDLNLKHKQQFSLKTVSALLALETSLRSDCHVVSRPPALFHRVHQVQGLQEICLPVHVREQERCGGRGQPKERSQSLLPGTFRLIPPSLLFYLFIHSFILRVTDLF